MGNRVQRIEMNDALKILAGQVFIGIEAAAGQSHVSHGAFQRVLKNRFSFRIPYDSIVEVRLKIRQVIREIIVHRVFGGAKQRIWQAALIAEFTESVFQRFYNGLLISIPHSPKENGTVAAAVCIRNIENMAEP